MLREDGFFAEFADQRNAKAITVNGLTPGESKYGSGNRRIGIINRKFPKMHREKTQFLFIHFRLSPSLDKYRRANYLGPITRKNGKRQPAIIQAVCNCDNQQEQ